MRIKNIPEGLLITETSVNDKRFFSLPISTSEHPMSSILAVVTIHDSK